MSCERLVDLLKQADELDDSPEKVGILEEAGRLADVLGDLQTGFEIRQDLVTAAYRSGADDRAFGAFSWCRAHSEQCRDEISQQLMLRHYMWMLYLSADFNNISLETVREMQSDLQNRLTSQGIGLRSYYKVRMINSMEMGFHQESIQDRLLWAKTPYDDLICCTACELDVLLLTQVSLGEYSKAIQTARPILTGEKSCVFVPVDTYWKLLVACLFNNDMTGAEEFFTKGYRFSAGKTAFLRSNAWYLCYLTRILDIPRGLRLIERHLPLVSQTVSPSSRMHFLSATASFFERLDEAHPQAWKIRIPELVEIYRDDDLYSPNDLAVFFRGQANGLAAAFDARNGNGYVSWELARNRALGLGQPPPNYKEPPVCDRLAVSASRPEHQEETFMRPPMKPEENP